MSVFVRKRVTRDVERQLIRRAKDGDMEAMEALLSHMETNVHAIARKLSGYNLPHEDLCQEGRIGLIQAIEKFNLASETGLSAYAGWYIKGAMVQHCLSNAQGIALNHTDANRVYHDIPRLLREVQSHHPEATQREVTDTIAKELKLTPSEVETFIELRAFGTRSLNTPLGGDVDGLEHIDVIPDEEAMTPEEIIMLAEEPEQPNVAAMAAVAQMERALDILEARERYIIRWRYLQEGEGVSIAQLSDVLGITESRIRQIIPDVMAKIKRYIEQERQFGVDAVKVGRKSAVSVEAAAPDALDKQTVQEASAEAIDSLLRAGLAPTASSAVKILHALGETKKRTTLLVAHGQCRENLDISQAAEDAAAMFPLPRIPEVGKGDMPPSMDVTGPLIARANAQGISDEDLSRALLATDDPDVVAWMKRVRARAYGVKDHGAEHPMAIESDALGVPFEMERE